MPVLTFNFFIHFTIPSKRKGDLPFDKSPPAYFNSRILVVYILNSIFYLNSSCNFAITEKTLLIPLMITKFYIFNQ